MIRNKSESIPDKLGFVLGRCPEIIKLAPVIRECDACGIPYVLIHTGQYYSEELDAVFFEQLNLPNPEYNLGVGSKSQGKQTGEMIAQTEEIIMNEMPEVFLVQSDTFQQWRILLGGFMALIGMMALFSGLVLNQIANMINDGGNNE